MKHPKTKGERLAKRKAKIKAMTKYTKLVMRIPDMEYKIIARKAKHPKCPCQMCKRERSRDTRHLDNKFDLE